MNSITSSTRSVFITGCSTGIGRATARLLKDNGWHVYASARKEADLSSLSDEGFSPIELDVSDDASVSTAVESVLQATNGTLSALVNNAGFGQPGAMEDLSRDQMRNQFEINVFGMQQLTNELLPAMLQQGHGRIVNVSSVVGRLSLPFFGIYSASKFAMEAMSDAMRVELGDKGIKVVLIEPGPIESSFRSTSTGLADSGLDLEKSRFADVYRKEILNRNEQKNPEDRWMLSPEAVAEKILKALTIENPKARYAVTLPAKIAPTLKALLPTSLLDKMMINRWTKRHPSS